MAGLREKSVRLSLTAAVTQAELVQSTLPRGTHSGTPTLLRLPSWFPSSFMDSTCWSGELVPTGSDTGGRHCCGGQLVRSNRLWLAGSPPGAGCLGWPGSQLPLLVSGFLISEADHLRWICRNIRLLGCSCCAQGTEQEEAEKRFKATSSWSSEGPARHWKEAWSSRIGGGC